MFSTKTAAGLLAVFSSILITPIRATPALIPRDAPEANATCQYWLPSTASEYTYKVTLDSTQDGGWCGGMWANLNNYKGQYNCEVRHNTQCPVDNPDANGNIHKVLEFSVNLACEDYMVADIIYWTTSPQVSPRCLEVSPP
ncbi:Uu.00g039160.m01.CDS01 [Anthostomella pinea]|uniref:Uu.00g039160.m01.CDS01 n=1 Tax=Anthostomella pinea TaxID=933095 RepID=A0AAI8YDY4_9PEZI|nr:Uu.00g039160.m01.CDS01 [Anthostomella pinea]